MSNQTEEEYLELQEAQLKEINEFYDLNEAWENNPTKLLLEKQIEDIGRSIDELINWQDNGKK